jgi:cytochrome P450
VFAGQVNSGIMNSWLPIHWATQPVWKVKARDEVDAAVAKHRTSSTQSPADVLDSLTLKDWESEFPLLDLSLREAIRLGLTGVDYRMNDKDFDIPIGNTGECVPKGAYAVYLHGNSHRDPSIYKDPETFDPSRYFADRAEDKKEQHAYIGWGSGRHPCLGIRSAKLETSLVSAYLLALCDFELSDKEGNALKEPPPRVNMNQNHVARLEEPVYLRLRARKV